MKELAGKSKKSAEYQAEIDLGIDRILEGYDKLERIISMLRAEVE